MIDDLRPYPDYKDSGLPWLGTIPTHWEIRRNGRLFAQRNETGFPDLPILEVSLKTGVRVRDFDTSNRKQVMSDREKYKCARRGDIAYNMMRLWQGAVGVAPVDGLVSPAYVVARPLPGTQTRYYEYVFRTGAYMNEVNRFSRGIVSDRNRLYWEDFKQMPSLFPPPDEQSLIARFLDNLDRCVRRYVRARRQLIVLLNEQKQAIIHHAVTRGLDPNVHLKPSGVEWLGDIPEHWAIKKLRFLVDTRGGMTPSKADASYWNGSIPWVSPKDMKRAEISDSIDHITDGAVDQTGIGLIPPPAVLIVVRGMILARTFPVGVTTVTVTINQDMKALLPRPSLDAGYMRYLLVGLQAAVRMLVEESGHGTRVLRTDLWRNLALPIPPLQDQARLVAAIVRETAITDAAIARAECEIELIREYRSHLISDVAMGKLDVRVATENLPDEADVPDALDDADARADVDDVADEDLDAVPEEIDA